MIFPSSSRVSVSIRMGTPGSRRNKKNSPPSWQSFFLPPASPFIPVSPVEFLPLSPFLLRYLCLTFVVALLEGSSLFSLRFFLHQPLFVYPWLPLSLSSFVSRLSSVRRRRSILSGRSSLDHWPGRKLEHVSTLLDTSYTPIGGMYLSYSRLSLNRLQLFHISLIIFYLVYNYLFLYIKYLDNLLNLY